MESLREEDSSVAATLDQYYLLKSQQDDMSSKSNNVHLEVSGVSLIAPAWPPTETAIANPAMASSSQASCNEEDYEAYVALTQDIKTTLLCLLNSQTAKKEPAFRDWVQHRLMTAEQQLKRAWRRRSSNSSDDAKAAAEAVKEGLMSTGAR